MHPLLIALGARLRSRRTALGLTQALLAEATGISVRYLVQAEQGEANLTVARLHELCVALDLSLDELFRGLGPGDTAARRIALVGLRGAGKSTVGQALADSLGASFVELDRLVEADAGMSLAEIFELRGEAEFRELERRALETVLESTGPTVIATGGSIVKAADTWDRLRAASLTVWLRASPASHLHRVQAQGDLRPMHGRPDALRELEAILAERAPLYSQADLALDTDALGVDGVVAALVGRQ